MAAHADVGGFIAEPLFPDTQELPPAEARRCRFDRDTVLANRFRIIDFVDRGGMGEVYEAEDLELHETVALKTLRPDLDLTDGMLKRFRHEIQLGRRITHPN